MGKEVFSSLVVVIAYIGVFSVMVITLPFATKMLEMLSTNMREG
jgi:hypothetical protein